MASENQARHSGSDMGSQLPVISSLGDLTTLEAANTETKQHLYTTFYHLTKDEVVFFGQSAKRRNDITLTEFREALLLVPDEDIFPEVPTDIDITLAPDNMDDASVFIKRPSLDDYEVRKGTGEGAEQALKETLLMEQISKSTHLNFVRYYGCRVRRGRIVAIVLERLEQTLAEYVSTPAF